MRTQLGAWRAQGLHLRGGALDIRGVGIGHRLNHDGRTAADADAPTDTCTENDG